MIKKLQILYYKLMLSRLEKKVNDFNLALSSYDITVRYKQIYRSRLIKTKCKIKDIDKKLNLL